MRPALSYHALEMPVDGLCVEGVDSAASADPPTGVATG
jgi:hypothetical protein